MGRTLMNFRSTIFLTMKYLIDAKKMIFECRHMNKQHKRLAMAGIYRYLYFRLVMLRRFLHKFTDRSFTNFRVM